MRKPDTPAARRRRKAAGAVLLAAIAAFRSQALSLLEAYGSNTIDSQVWAKAYVDLLITLHTQASYAGREVAASFVSGASLLPSTYDDAYGVARAAEQAREFVPGFRRDLEQGRYRDAEGRFDPDLAQSRIDLYANGAHGTAHQMLVGSLPRESEGYIRWILDPGADEAHCEECPAWAAGGPYTPDTLPAVPGDGKSRCKTNCLPGDTLVRAGEIKRVYRHWYDGELVRIKTAAGHELSGTPNHPVLTTKGWVGLGALVEGDHVLSYGVGEDLPGFDPYAVHAPSTLSEVYESLSAGGHVGRLMGVDVDFHGDRPYGDVDVVTAHRFLLDGIETGAFESVSDFLLPSAYLKAGTLFPHGFPPVLGVGATHRAPSGIGGEGGGFASLWSHSLVSSDHRLGGRADRSPAFDETLANGSTGDSEAISQRLLGLPGVVRADEIVNVERKAFSGHVYNLETMTETFVSNNIITHNCRCHLEVWGIPVPMLARP